MKRWQCPIHNSTLETFYRSIIARYGLLHVKKCYKLRHFCRETTSKYNQFSEFLTWRSNLSNLSDKAFKGTIVNRALSSLNRESLEITPTIFKWPEKVL